jgi:putative acetyltransferase
MKINIRMEEPEDIQQIHAVEFRAFRSEGEPRLVDRLREEDIESLSLVAEADDKIVGHILFSPMTLDPEEMNYKHRVFGLAPLAVLPDYQKMGIGSKLVQRGLSTGISLGWKLVFVLGSPEYYSRFGFKQASKYNFYSEYEVPEENFMVVSLEPGGLFTGPAYLAQYHPVFKETGV